MARFLLLFGTIFQAGFSEILKVYEWDRSPLSCSNLSVIFINEASYGPERLPESPDSRTCYTIDVTEKVVSRCHLQVSCVLASNNNIFGDPCVGDTKYLNVSYYCKSEATTDKSTTETAATIQTTSVNCHCQCHGSYYTTTINNSHLTLSEKIATTKREIQINKNETAQYKAKKSCARDDRRSSSTIGIVAALIIAVPFVLALSSDLKTCFKR